MTAAENIVAFPTESGCPLGLWDVRDGLWLGTTEEPLVYGDDTLARLAATIATEQLGRWVMAKPFGGANKLRDEIETPITATEAIDRLENRWRTRPNPRKA